MRQQDNRRRSAPDLERAIRVGLAKALLQPCLTCGAADTAAAAAFQPDAENSRRFGAPAGKTRLYFYALCEACYGSAGRAEAAEAAILERLGR